MPMMPQVRSCEVTTCFYNQGQVCHANAINVGGIHPQCDTFTASMTHAAPAPVGMVGACKVEDCRFNNELSCSAPGIDVGFHENHADCETYTPQ